MGNARISLVVLSENGGQFKSAGFEEFDVTEVHDTTSLHAALQIKEADCILVAGETESVNPIDLLESIHHGYPDIPVIFSAPELTASMAVRLVRAGASHCFNSTDSQDHIIGCLLAAVEDRRLRRQVHKRAKEASEPWRSHLVGDSRAMEAVAETIRVVGKRRCTVLITGETGTGKEMAARALHASSQRSQHAMVAVNCSALPENLLEAELFGHTRGAFTGATSMRVGRFEQANKSTIFLDEIGEMPLELQAKLLRVLQEREIQRLGSSETIKIDVRVIAATNVDLQERVRQGKFREDLFYRLNVVPLQMPPLRKRITDIPALVTHFIQKVCAFESIPVKHIQMETMRRLCVQQWPGNVRQLENTVEMAIAVSGENPELTARDFGLTSAPVSMPAVHALPEMPFERGEAMNFEAAVTRFELAMLNNALKETGGNKTAAAERLGMKRTTLIMKMRSFGNSGLLTQ